MKTKLILLSLFIASVSFAQSNKEDVDMIQAKYGKEKKTIMSEFIRMSETEKAAFWPLYDEYETKRKELGKKRVALLTRYVNNYTTMDDAAMDQVIMDTDKLADETENLISEYYKKLKKGVGVKPAAQFYQLEHYFLVTVRGAILEGIPYIGELDK